MLRTLRATIGVIYNKTQHFPRISRNSSRTFQRSNRWKII